MLRTTIAAAALLAGLGIAAAPSAAADTPDLVNVDVVGGHVTVSPGPDWPLPFWDGVKPPGAKWSYKTGYNISPRYTFRTDPVTGKRTANYDNGCNGAC